MSRRFNNMDSPKDMLIADAIEVAMENGAKVARLKRAVAGLCVLSTALAIALVVAVYG